MSGGVAQLTATGGVGFRAQTALLLRRLITVTARSPVIVVVNLASTAFFLITYDGLLGGDRGLATLVGGNYQNFILPVGVLFAGLAGGSAGFLLLRDIESGYFRRQLSMPLSRLAIVVAPMIIGAGLVLLQTVVVIAIGLILGADPETGVGGLLVMVGLSLLWGLGLAGYSVAVGLRTGSPQAAQAVSLINFPLIFLSPVFVPKDQLREWVQVIATINPTTYVLNGMRSLMIDGWEAKPLLEALVAALAFAGVAIALATLIARQTTRRG
jgi:ABC-2 type transport system permease protein